MGLSGEEERRPGQGCAPLPLVRIGQGEGGPAPSSFSLSLFHLMNPIPTRIGGEVLLPEGVGLLLARLLLAGRTPPLILYIRGQGAPVDTQVDPRDHILSRVRCPLPP